VKNLKTWTAERPKDNVILSHHGQWLNKTSQNWQRSYPSQNFWWFHHPYLKSSRNLEYKPCKIFFL